MKSIAVHGLGLWFKGASDWATGREILLGKRALDLSLALPRAPAIVPPNERRRITPTVALALHVAWQAVEIAGFDAGKLPSVFVSSEGDAGIVDRICDTLAVDALALSPTLFHNSVHNAAAGYWSIAVGSMEASTTLSAHDGSVAAGLLEAATQLSVAEKPLLLVFYDVPPPPPLLAKRPLTGAFGAALVLSPFNFPGTLGILELDVCETREEGVMDSRFLEALRIGNPAARSLPLLAALAGSVDRYVTLPFNHGCSLQIKVAPCV